MKYESYSYLYPPRPDTAIPPNMLDFYENRGFVAQLKKNGAGSIIAVSPSRELIVRNRHKTIHKLWEADARTRQAFLGLSGGWYVFVAELLHSKVVGLRHTNYINDILVANGEHLVGTTFEERQKMLTSLFPHAVGHISGGYRVIDDFTWLANNYASDFVSLFQTIEKKRQPEDEGLVLKNPKAKLAYGMTERSNSAWQVKCRLPTKNFSF